MVEPHIPRQKIHKAECKFAYRDEQLTNGIFCVTLFKQYPSLQ